MNDGDVLKLQFLIGFLVVSYGYVAFREGFAGVADLASGMMVELVVVASLTAVWLLVGRR